MLLSPPNTPVTGFHVPVVRKPNPNFRMEGIEFRVSSTKKPAIRMQIMAAHARAAARNSASGQR